MLHANVPAPVVAEHSYSDCCAEGMFPRGARIYVGKLASYGRWPSVTGHAGEGQWAIVPCDTSRGRH
jgi:hypothetical protein